MTVAMVNIIKVKDEKGSSVDGESDMGFQWCKMFKINVFVHSSKTLHRNATLFCPVVLSFLCCDVLAPVQAISLSHTLS